MTQLNCRIARLILGAVGIAGLATALMPHPATASTGAYQLIVHPSNPVTQITRSEVSLFFLGEPRKWTSGELVQPVDQSARSPVREAFSREVLHLSVDAVQAHWMKLIVSGTGKRPPPTASEEDILDMIASKKGMIAYVSAEAPLPAGVRVVDIRD